MCFSTDAAIFNDSPPHILYTPNKRLVTPALSCHLRVLTVRHDLARTFITVSTQAWTLHTTSRACTRFHYRDQPKVEELDAAH